MNRDRPLDVKGGSRYMLKELKINTDSEVDVSRILFLELNPGPNFYFFKQYAWK